KIGAAIQSARIERGWSQTQLAKRAGITRASLSNYERGRPMPVKTLSAIAVQLELKPGHFFPEAETAGKEARGVAAARQQRLDQIQERLRSAELATLDAILSVLNIARPN
ncbi:MAG: helix-turn-helix transcriptional regulator, partial [Pseudomonadota bacterium]